MHVSFFYIIYQANMLELLRAVNEMYRRKERRVNCIICGESVEFRLS